MFQHALRADAGPQLSAEAARRRREGKHLQATITHEEHGRLRYAVSLSGFRNFRDWALPILLEHADRLIAEAGQVSVRAKK